MSLNGDLAELPLPDLVEMTAIGGKTGLLILRDEEGATTGELVFRDGRLTGARRGKLVGEKAFYALLALKEGTFDFDPDAELGDESLNLATESLLIEGMRRLDETYGLRRRLPAPSLVRYLSGSTERPLEVRVLGYLGPGARSVGDIVAALLVNGDADEYDTLQALERLAERQVVRIERPQGADPSAGQPPQPELER